VREHKTSEMKSLHPNKTNLECRPPMWKCSSFHFSCSLH